MVTLKRTASMEEIQACVDTLQIVEDEEDKHLEQADQDKNVPSCRKHKILTQRYQKLLKRVNKLQNSVAHLLSTLNDVDHIRQKMEHYEKHTCISRQHQYGGPEDELINANTSKMYRICKRCMYASEL